MAKKKQAPTTVRDVTRDDLATELEVHQDSIGRWDRQGAPHERRGRKYWYNVPEYQAWMRANNVTGKEGRPIEGDSPDLEAARLRKENALASKYELQVSRERRDLIPIDEVRTVGGRAIATFRNRLNGAGAILSPRLEGRDAAERQDILDKYHRDLLLQLENDFEGLVECG